MNFFTYIRPKESRCKSYNSVYFILAKENWFFFSASRCSLGRTVHSYLQRKRTPESRAAPISMARDHGLQHWFYCASVRIMDVYILNSVTNRDRCYLLPVTK